MASQKAACANCPPRTEVDLPPDSAHAPCSEPALSSFDTSNFEWLGFDMDHTFAQYNLEAVNALIFDGLREHVAKNHVYPEEALEGMKFDVDFVTKGSVFDVHRGNFVNLTKEGKVCCCKHGSKHVLTADEIVEAYGPSAAFPHFEKMRNFERDASAYLPFDSAFSIPSASILAKLVDLADKKAQEELGASRADSYERELHALFGAFEHQYNPAALQERRGMFFPALCDHPEKYLVKTPANVFEFLEQARARGQKTMLVTNSRDDFAHVVMSYVAGPDWDKHFDLVVTSATKPAFFTGSTPFNSIKLQSGREAYEFGNWTALRDDHGIGTKSNSVLYFGDDLRGDVAALKATGGVWAGVAIVEELGDNQHANEYHVFHCPHAPRDVLETQWMNAIEENAIICIPSVEALSSSQKDGILHNCKTTQKQGQTLWFPVTPIDLLQKGNEGCL